MRVCLGAFVANCTVGAKINEISNRVNYLMARTLIPEYDAE